MIKIVLRERPELRTPKELGAGREEGLRGVTGLVEVGLSSPTRYDIAVCKHVSSRSCVVRKILIPQDRQNNYLEEAIPVRYRVLST